MASLGQPAMAPGATCLDEGRFVESPIGSIKTRPSQTRLRWTNCKWWFGVSRPPAWQLGPCAPTDGQRGHEAPGLK
jgi:hypothetical protein